MSMTSSERPPGSIPAHDSQHPSLQAERHMAEVYGAHRNDEVAAEHLAGLKKLLGMKP